METIIKILGVAVMFAFGLFIVAILTAFPLMWLWNYVVPFVFHGTFLAAVVLDFWHALALSLLCGCLFKSSSSSSSSDKK